MRHPKSWRRIVATVAGATALALAVSGCTAGQVSIDTPPQVDAPLPAETVEQLQASVEHAMAATRSSGAIVGVWVPWSGTWVAGLGSNAVDSDEPVTADMAFRIGDVTRSMTCDVLYALEEEGTVAFDDPVTEYVGGISAVTDVTLIDLCNGTSGLRSSESTILPAWLATPERVWNPLEIASYGLGKGRTAPGEAYRDSDVAYLLLGIALENASHRSARELIDDYVADPLGLSHTELPTRPAAEPSTSGPVLNGYRSPRPGGQISCKERTDVTTMSSSIGFTDSGVVSTIEDLGRYGAALATDALTGEDAGRWDSALPVDPKGASWYQYTGGAFLAGSMIGQQGSTLGYMTSVYSDPTTGMTVAVVLNNSAMDSSMVGYLARQLAAIASKAPAAQGQTAPAFGLPWTAEHYNTLITERAECPIE